MDLSLGFKEVIADSSRDDTLPVFFHKNIPRMVDNKKRMNHFTAIFIPFQIEKLLDKSCLFHKMHIDSLLHL